jgi:small subunit ribosomal protein S27Ae
VTSKAYAYYDASSGLKRKNKFCPKCGAGVFMANHKDRVTCGKCGYMEKI